MNPKKCKLNILSGNFFVRNLKLVSDICDIQLTLKKLE